MSYWKNPNVSLGIIKANSGERKVIFRGNEDLPEILTIEPLCGCTTTKFDKKTRELHITYTNSKIPEQVQGPQRVAKRIIINYEGGTGETLTISATRIR